MSAGPMSAVSSTAVACLVALIGLAPMATGVQAKTKKSERAMKMPKTPPAAKSERAMPAAGAAAGTPPAAAERAMPAPDKK